MKRYETVASVLDNLTHMIVDSKMTIIQVRAIGKEVIKLFEAVEGVIYKLKDFYEFSKQHYVSSYDKSQRRPIKFLTVILKVIKKQ